MVLLQFFQAVLSPKQALQELEDPPRLQLPFKDEHLDRVWARMSLLSPSIASP